MSVASTVELFDTHCHIDFPAFDGDRAALLRRASSLGINEMFVPGTDPRQWTRLGELAPRCASVGLRLHLGVGLHPHRLTGMTEEQRSEAMSALARHAVELGARAIGECGLDEPLTRRGGPPLQEQVAILEEHLAVAERLSLPTVLHVVRAHGAALEVLERKRVSRGGILHWYSGAPELLPRYAALGFRFGFGAASMDPRQRRIRAAAVRATAECVLLETDAPDQPPPGGPLRNEPATLVRVAEELARLRGTTVEEIARVSTRNARAVFGLDSP